MADLTEVAIEAALLAELATFAAAQSPAVPVSFPNTKFDEPVAKAGKYREYLRAQHFPIDTTPVGIPHDSWNRFEGIFQIDVFHGIEAGALEPLRLVGAVIEHFGRGKVMTRDGIEVRIYQRPSRSNLVVNGAWVMTPVRVRYLSFVKP